MSQLVRKSLLDTVWAAGYLTSGTMSATSKSYETLLKVAEAVAAGQVIKGSVAAASGAMEVTTNYGSDVLTALKILIDQEHSVAPEAFNMTDGDWEILADVNKAAGHLRKYASLDPDNIDVLAFREAARVLTVASTLSYAREDEANLLFEELEKTFKRLGSSSWTAEVLQGKNRRAQAMLLMYDDTSSVAPPIAILSFRGTELPDEQNEGFHEFIPDWFRNFQRNPSEAPGLGLVAKGFHEAWQGSPHGTTGLKAEFLDTIHAFSKDKCGGMTVDLFVTGHSAGGALAQVSLLDLSQAQDNSFKLRGCITLAQPRF
jgi:hypothetical protein